MPWRETQSTRPRHESPLADASAVPDSGPLVVLEERQLEEPLEVAIRRVQRQQPGARILVVGTGDAATSEPHVLQPRAPVGRPTGVGESVSSEVEDALHRVGAKWLHAAEIMAHWTEEVRGHLAECREADPSGQARLGDLLAWMQCAVDESIREARKAAHGMEPRNTAALARDAASRVHQQYSDIDLQLPPVDGDWPLVTCRAGAVRAAFQCALHAVACRIGRRGALRITIEEGALFLLHRFCGEPAGAPPIEPAPHLASRLQELVVTAHGGCIFRGRGPYADSELVVALPLPQLEEIAGVLARNE